MSLARLAASLLVASSFCVAGEAVVTQVPFFRQEKNGCGAASVAMVAHYWANQSEKSSATPTPGMVYDQLYRAKRRGILLADMKEYLEGIGYHAFTFRGQWSDLEKHVSKGRPVIIGLKKGRSKGLHFAVLVGTEGDHVWLNDPTRKRPSRLRQAEFETRWEFADRWMLLAAPSKTEQAAR